MKATYFTLYPNCFLTRGQVENIILDTHRGRYLPIKSQIADLLENELKTQPVSQVKSLYPGWIKGLDAYLNHFVENEYGFYTEEPHHFPTYDLNFHHPGVIFNSIIAIESVEDFDYQLLFQDLLELGAGNIKNYLTHTQTFGNVARDSIRDIVESPDFQEKWHISNDQIAKCRTCQFRYMCISNSDIVFKDGKYYKVDDCSFDPLTNRWAST